MNKRDFISTTTLGCMDDHDLVKIIVIETLKNKDTKM